MAKRKVKRAAPAKSSADPVHIAISQSLEVRKQLLESSRDSLVLMQMFDKIEDLREKKRAAFEEFDFAVDELRGLMKQLKELLPLEVANTATKRAQPKAKAMSVAETQRSSHLNELEGELAEIESKLKKLG